MQTQSTFRFHWTNLERSDRGESRTRRKPTRNKSIKGKSWTFWPLSLFPSRMTTPAAKKTLSPVGLVVDAVLVLGFFAFIFTLLKSHVPSNDPSMITLWAGLAAACMSGVFWLAVQMFRVVLAVQLADRRK